MHGRLGKIVEAARVIEVEVAHDDVAHVARIEAERRDLPHRRHLLAKLGAGEREKDAAQARARRGDVAEAKAGVDEHEGAAGLDEQTMAGETRAQTSRAPVHEVAAERTARDAVEMMN